MLTHIKSMILRTSPLSPLSAPLTSSLIVRLLRARLFDIQAYPFLIVHKDDLSKDQLKGATDIHLLTPCVLN